MNTVGTGDLKAHLSDILHRVERGEHIVVTRRGVPVALIVPPAASGASADRSDLAFRMRELRARQPPIDAATLAAWRTEGRR